MKLLNSITGCIIVIVAAFTTSFASYAQERNEKISIEAYSEIAKTGYVGEAMEYTVILKSSVPNIADIRVASSPEFPQGLEIYKGVIHNQKAREITENGKTFYCWTIQRNFILPEVPGKYTINGWKFVAFVSKERIVKDFFWGARRVVEYDEYPISCKPVTFKAEKLPENKTGIDFSGCVGEFVIEGWFPPGKISKGNEALAVFTISGFGSLENLKIPNISKLFTNGCHLKNIDQEESQSQRGGKLFSEVTLTCTFIPDETEFQIEPLKILFFNPVEKKYETRESETLFWNGSDNNKNKSESGSRDAIEV